MSEPRDQQEHRPQHVPLDYARPDHSMIAGPMVGGIILGVAAVCIIGFAGALVAEQINQRPWALHSISLAVVFFVLAGGAITLSIHRMNRATRGWLLIGFLLGAGIMSLMEGLCFMRS